MFITGEAGIDKTRLAAELRTQALARGCQWLEGRYDKEGSIPLKPYAEAVRSYLSTKPAGSLAQLSGPYSTEITRAFPAIADLDTAAQAPDLAGEDAKAARQQHLEAMCHLFFSMASEQPMILFLDDLQWGRPWKSCRPSIKPPVAAGRRLSGRRTSRETYPIPVGAGNVPKPAVLNIASRPPYSRRREPFDDPGLGAYIFGAVGGPGIRAFRG